MNAKTLEAIKRHGETLLAAFPNATEKDPVALCKKLRRIETATHRVMVDYCNGTCDASDAHAAKVKALDRAGKLLAVTFDGQHYPIHINQDPRGYALKVDDEWTSKFNDKRYQAKLPALHRDMGGYGILAPDLNQD